MANTSKDWLLLGGGIRHITATQAEVTLHYITFFNVA